MPVIAADGLTKVFGKLTAVDRLSFEVMEGEVFGLLGPNGAGKTTVIRMLASLILPTEGRATVGGHDVRKEGEKVRQAIGVLTENPSLYERLTAYENLEFYAEAYGMTGDAKRGRIRHLLESFDLWQRRDSRVATFSKGMKQKLAIARAMVHSPSILLLDEPTTGLDPESAKEIKDMIGDLSRQGGTILLSTHRLGDAEKLCSRAMIIAKGRCIVIGSPEELGDMASPPVLRIGLRGPPGKIAEAARQVPGVRGVAADGSALLVTSEGRDLEELAPEVVKGVVLAGGAVSSVSISRPTLEEAYLKLMGGRIGDA